MHRTGDVRMSLPYRESFLRSLLWHDVRMDLIFDVLAHPDGMPTIPELLYMNKFIDEDEVLAELSLLVEYDILERVPAPMDEREEDDLPQTFYALSVDGWAAVNHFEQQFNELIQSRLRTTYEQVSHPEYIERCQTVPRPEPSTKDDCDE